MQICQSRFAFDLSLNLDCPHKLKTGLIKFMDHICPRREDFGGVIIIMEPLVAHFAASK